MYQVRPQINNLPALKPFQHDNKTTIRKTLFCGKMANLSRSLDPNATCVSSIDGMGVCGNLVGLLPSLRDGPAALAELMSALHELFFQGKRKKKE
jgi:hypothetical protein